MNNQFMKGDVSAWPVALLRIGTGVMFLLASLGKVRAGSAWPDRMAGFIGAQENTYGFYTGFLESFVLPNKSIIAYFVAYGELFVGLALIFGLFSRYAAALGLFLTVNFWFAKGSAFWAPTNHDSLYILIFAVLALTASGRALGLDGFIAGRKGSSQ